MNYTIDINMNDLKVESRGAETYGIFNVRVKVESEDLIEEAEDFITYVLDYQIESQKKITSGQTLTYGYWLVQFKEKDKFLDVWEYNSDATNFVEGANLTLSYLHAQYSLCEVVEAEFDAPTADKFVTVYTQIFESKEIQGVRYEEDGEKSGWLLYCEEQDLDSLHEGAFLTLRLYELTLKRPDLLKFLGLPTGYRFVLKEDEYNAWEDRNLFTNYK
ncbi:immunity protein Imm33 domain-containing protein [Priestia megaterium]|uniref:immunity protein Imm33 domain-containing protein n=1 Tax=Priestia megaterium TaxID=1404 RepID=UPI00221FE56C|nr:hypothetical protein [Priestia megaterium]UYV55660.1 hypothetical protein OHU65_26730 [Priestia megaterium]